MAHIRKCTVCGKEYNYCPRCRQYEHLPKWYVNYCGEDCKETYTILNKLAFNHITTEEAKIALDKVTVPIIIRDDLKEVYNKVNEDNNKSFKKKIYEKKEIVNED